MKTSLTRPNLLKPVAWGMLILLCLANLFRVLLEPIFFQEAFDLKGLEMRMWWRDTKSILFGREDIP